MDRPALGLPVRGPGRRGPGAPRGAPGRVHAVSRGARRATRSGGACRRRRRPRASTRPLARHLGRPGLWRRARPTGRRERRDRVADGLGTSDSNRDVARAARGGCRGARADLGRDDLDRGVDRAGPGGGRPGRLRSARRRCRGDGGGRSDPA
ncbi:MAG: hypothetical protein PVH96_16455 [Gemmatimonadota bacterium]